MAPTIAQSVGVDIAKDTLEVHLYPEGRRRQFANEAAGWQSLIGWLGGLAVARVVFEPTGRYHHGFERCLAAAGFAMVKLNPRQARRFAEAIGQPAKTDAVDAAMLARFGALIEPPSRAVLSDTLDEMRELHVARRGLIKDRVATLNRAQAYRSWLLRGQVAARLKQINHQLQAIDATLRRLLGSDVTLKSRFEILLSIPGLGEATALALLIEMPELGHLANGSAASLAGLAPVARDSGQHRGKRYIRSGRASLRQALYMPALVAARFNADLKAKYQALLAAGKPPKLALTAIMRKLLVLANSLLRDGRTWSARPPGPRQLQSS